MTSGTAGLNESPTVVMMHPSTNTEMLLYSAVIYTFTYVVLRRSAGDD
jgi:hypothetical protein